MMRDERVLAFGSGFMWEELNDIAIVTAWHCLTGTHPETRQSLNPANGARPNKVAVSILMQDMSERTITIPLYDPDSGAPIWYIHRLGFAELDLAVLWFPRAALPDKCMNLGVNTLLNSSISLHVGADLFILGYPRNLDRLGLPVWKRASLAMDPDATLAERGKRHLLVDTASREGMSGALVIARSRGVAEFENKGMAAGGVYTRLVGVYTGRVAGADEMAAQIGIVWPIRYVRQVIMSGIRDTFS